MPVSPASLGPETAGSFELFFDGSAIGLSTNGEDIDGIAMFGDDLLVSRVGSWSVGGLQGGDEDVIRFTPDNPADYSHSRGAWSLYFDGSQVGLTTSYEDVWGIWFDESRNEAFVTTSGSFSVSGANGDAADVLRCGSATYGNGTNCGFDLYWDGSAHGFAGENMDALHVSRQSHAP